MNIQKIFDAVKSDPRNYTLMTVVIELEKQGYKVIINERFYGSVGLEDADETGDTKYLPSINGIKFTISNKEEEQEFKIHWLDDDRICFTQTESIPVILNPKYTVDLYASN